MGKQIQIAQAAADEREISAWLSRDEPWLTLPWAFPTRRPVPVPLGRLRDRSQFIFPERLADAVLARVVKCEPATWRGETAASVKDYLVYPRSYIGIEWTRSQRLRRTVEKGRYYLDTSDEAASPAPYRRLLTGVMNALMAEVRRRSPLKVVYTLPIYVGPHLADQLRSGGVTPVGDLSGRLVPNTAKRVR